jgi:hypothetical protein
MPTFTTVGHADVADTPAVPITADVPEGSLLLVFFGDGFGNGETLTGVTDTQGNTYSVDFDGEGDVDGDGVVAVASSVIAHPLTDSDTVTPTFAGSVATGSADTWIMSVTGGDYSSPAAGSGAAGVDDSSPCTVEYASQGGLLVGFAAFQGHLTVDSTHGWSTVMDGGDDQPGSIMTIAYQKPSAGGVTFAPSGSDGYGAAAVVEYLEPEPNWIARSMAYR